MTADAKLSMRRATPQDAVTLSELAMRSKAHWGYSAAFMEACRAELAVTPRQITDASFTVELVRSGQETIGYFAMERLVATDFELAALFVEPAWIGCGAGRRLMQRALEAMTEQGGTRLLVQGDPHVERFYLAAGCKRIGERESGSIPGRMLPLFVCEL